MKRSLVLCVCLILPILFLFIFSKNSFAQYPIFYTISGRVFIDEGSGNPLNDGDGIQQAGEPNYNNVDGPVKIGNGLTNVFTDAFGRFIFSTVPVGSYSITRLTLPAGAVYVGSPPGSYIRTTPRDQIDNTAFGIRRVPRYQVTVNLRVPIVPGTCTFAGSTPVPPLSSGTAGIANSSYNATGSVTTGTYTFPNVLQGNGYVLSISALPLAYSMSSPHFEASPGLSANGSNGVGFDLNSNRTVTFCIETTPTQPWFQTDKGDVRFNSLKNPLPLARYGSSDPTSPGIYFSSRFLNTASDLGPGGPAAISQKKWLVKNEYSYNASSGEMAGTLSYSFFKSKAKQDGVAIQTINAINGGQIPGPGIYEYDNPLLPLTIPSFSFPAGRTVILVNGEVNVNNDISGAGLVILAAKGDILVKPIVSTLRGFYSSEGNIKIEGLYNCAIPTADVQLHVDGALIANSKRPFDSSLTGGKIIRERSLCGGNSSNPVLLVTSRPDFLTQLTDFYKTSYTKWEEEKP